MRVYLLLLFCIFCILLAVQECQSIKKRTKYFFREEPVVPCGGRNSKQVDVRGSRAQRRAAEKIIADFKIDSIKCNEKGPKTLLKHGKVRIDLQDPKSFPCDRKTTNGKLCRNLQLQQNVPRPSGFPTTVATVLIQCGKPFPIRYVRNAFVKSMTKCAKVVLEQ